MEKFQSKISLHEYTRKNLKKKKNVQFTVHIHTDKRSPGLKTSKKGFFRYTFSVIHFTVKRAWYNFIIRSISENLTE